MRAFSLSIIALLAATSVAAQECREVENDLDRLACYDRESGRTPVTETLDTPTESPWTVRSTQSEMTDDTTVTLTVDTEDALRCGFTPSTATLVLRCQENTTVIYINTSCHLTSGVGGYGRVTYRFDDNPSETREFRDSTNNRSLGLWGGGKSIPLIKKMFSHSSALFRFTPYGDNAVTARFDVSGLEEAITPLREACHW